MKRKNGKTDCKVLILVGFRIANFSKKSGKTDLKLLSAKKRVAESLFRDPFYVYNEIDGRGRQRSFACLCHRQKRLNITKNSPSFPNISVENFGVFPFFVYMAHGAKTLRHAPYLT